MRRCPSGKMISGVLLALLAFSGEAAPLKLLGLDDMSCLAWARGFLSGHNYANQRQQVTDVSSGTIALYAERFCRANPKASFADALYRMSDEFSGRGTALTK